MIRRVRERLSGIYNTGPEWLPARNGSNSSRGRAAAALQAHVRLFGSAARPGLAVPGQVHRLIKEAVSDENLACMYIGCVARADGTAGARVGCVLCWVAECSPLYACCVPLPAPTPSPSLRNARVTLNRRWLPML